MRGEENEKEEAPLAQQSTPMDGRGRVSCEASPPRAVRGDEGDADPEEAASLGPMQLDGEEGELIDEACFIACQQVTGQGEHYSTSMFISNLLSSMLTKSI